MRQGWVVAVLVCLLGIPCLGDDAAPGGSASPVVAAARVKFEAACETAKEAQSKVLGDAGRNYISALDTDLKEAMAKGPSALDEALKIGQDKKDAEAAIAALGEDPTHAAVPTPSAQKSLEAKGKFDLEARSALRDYRVAIHGAGQEYIAVLDDALKAAMGRGPEGLDEAKWIDGERKRIIDLASVKARDRRAGDPLADRVDHAIEAGVQYLYSQMQANGTWEIPNAGAANQQNNQPSGLTCLCAYALLTAGEKPSNPKLARTIDYIVSAKLTGTYELAFQSLALEKLPESPAVHAAIAQCAQKLLMGAERPGAPVGLYSYTFNAHTFWDHSCSQYGALGVWACSEAGIEVPDRYWEVVDRAWRAGQMADGGWGYTSTPEKPGPSKDSMTAAGIATLLITDDELASRRSIQQGNSSDQAIVNGIKWMMPHIAEGHDLYTMYGVERMGIASGYKYFGNVDWYKQGATALVAEQERTGSWPAQWGGMSGSAAYALLFLSRGCAPVVMSKLRYDLDPTAANPVEGNWNQRNRDLAGATKFIGDEFDTLTRWQIVDLSMDQSDLDDVPILYITGNKALKFSAEQESKLEQFMEDGGLIMGNADGGAKAFSDSFKALCEKLMGGKYKFRKLAADDPILAEQKFPISKWRIKPEIDGLSDGEREVALLIPEADPSLAWHTHQFKSKQEMFELACDIYQYCVSEWN